MSAIALLTSVVSLALQADPVAACQADVRTYADWTATPDTRWTFVASAPGGGALSYFGAEHSRDPADPQFAAIDRAFAEARPTVVFYEGPDRGVADTGAETISTRGESGYVRFLAGQASAPTRPLEPSAVDQIAALTPGFGGDRVLLFFVLREAARLRDRENLQGENLDRAVTRVLEAGTGLLEGGGLAVPFRDLAGLDAAYRVWWTDGSDWRAAPSEWFDPLADDRETGGRFMGAINRASSEFRNRHMYAVLAQAARSGERVFAVVGRNHVPMQTPALACALAAPD